MRKSILTAAVAALAVPAVASAQSFDTPDVTTTTAFYNSPTGAVVIAPGPEVGGSVGIQSFQLTNEPGGEDFNLDEFITPPNADDTSTPVALLYTGVGFGSSGFADPLFIGNVMPTGLDQMGFEDFITAAEWGTISPIGFGTMELVTIIPEPATAGLAGVAAMGLLVRRRRA